jgi:hypothetical protein
LIHYSHEIGHLCGRDRFRVRGLHLLALWMERKGWIYYTHTKPGGSSLGNAFLEVQSILEPNKKHLIQVKKEQKKTTEELGDEPGDDDSENQ